MKRNNYLVGYGFVILVATCAVFMPWAYADVRIDGGSTTITYNVGHVFFFPFWVATVAIVAGAVLGVLNTTKITSVPLVLALVPSLVGAVPCGVGFVLLAMCYLTDSPVYFVLPTTAHRMFMATPGSGLFLTAIAGVGGFVVCLWSHSASRRSSATGGSSIAGPQDEAVARP
jgi:hypothetical protein